MALGAWSLPRVSSACEPFFGPVETWPAEGAALPANGAIVLWGDQLRADAFVLRIDGEQVDYEVVNRFTGRDEHSEWRKLIGVRAAEELPVGSVAELMWCEPGCELVGSWVVEEADHEPPTPMSSAYFDLQLLSECGYSSCIHGGSLDFNVYAHVESDQLLDGPRLGVMRLYTTTPSPRELMIRPFDVPSGTFTTTLGSAALQGAEPGAPLCLEVRVFDQAGNEAPGSRRTCTPCHRAHMPSGQFCFGPEPEWTDDDLVEGSDCDGTIIEPLTPLDPVPPDDDDPDTGSDDGAASTSDGDSTTRGEPEGSTGDPQPPGPSEASSGSDGTGSDTQDPSQDDRELGEAGCSCRSTRAPIGAGGCFSLLLLVTRRRR